MVAEPHGEVKEKPHFSCEGRAVPGFLSAGRIDAEHQPGAAAASGAEPDM